MDGDVIYEEPNEQNRSEVDQISENSQDKSADNDKSPPRSPQEASTRRRASVAADSQISAQMEDEHRFDQSERIRQRRELHRREEIEEIDDMIEQVHVGAGETIAQLEGAEITPVVSDESVITLSRENDEGEETEEKDKTVQSMEWEDDDDYTPTYLQSDESRDIPDLFDFLNEADQD